MAGRLPHGNLDNVRWWPPGPVAVGYAILWQPAISLFVGNCSIFLDQSTNDLSMKVAATFIEQVGEMYSEKAMTACQSLTVL